MKKKSWQKKIIIKKIRKKNTKIRIKLNNNNNNGNSNNNGNKKMEKMLKKGGCF